MDIYNKFNLYCEELKYLGKYRELPVQPAPENSLIDFSSNDYLGLSKSAELLKEATYAGTLYGVGSTGSRLLSGNSKIFEDLEAQIAEDKKTATALIFNSGFQANFSVLSSLLDESVLGARAIVFFDRLNHSSLYQAVFLSKAELVRYQHNDMQHLSELLLKYQDDKRPKFIVTETIFGMDGDILPIADLVDIAKKHRAFVYFDEAHATGIIGKNGYGLTTNIELDDLPCVIMGTFSKALGCFGAYIAGSNDIKNYLINKSPGFIYSTSLSPMIIGAATKAWKLIKNMAKEREELLQKSNLLRTKLKELGFDTGKSASNIIPIIMGNETMVMNIKKQLLESGIMVSAIRPPTVPPKTSRLRIAINVNHSIDDLEKLASALAII